LYVTAVSDTQIIELDEPEPAATRVPWRAGSLSIVLAPLVVVGLVVSLLVPLITGRAPAKPEPTAAAQPTRGRGVLITALPQATARSIGDTQFIPTTPLVVTPGGPASAESGNPEVLETQSWTTFGPSYPARGDVAEAVLNGAAYVIGGTGTADDGLHVYRYDLRTGIRQPAPDLPVSLDHAMAATLNDRIYVFGGYVFGRPSARVFSLGANDARWIEHSPMPGARAAGGAAVLGDHIFIVGGVGENGDWIRDTWAYDTAGRWSTDLDPLPTPRDHLAVGTYRGKVCAAGGNGATQKFECFDPAHNEWSWMPDLRKPVIGGRAIEAAGWFWVVAQDVHIFTIDHWHFGPRPTWVRAGHALFAVDGTLYIIEGGSGPGSGHIEALQPQP
jgi:non-specific serine/threonine protein kinase